MQDSRKGTALEPKPVHTHLFYNNPQGRLTAQLQKVPWLVCPVREDSRKGAVTGPTHCTGGGVEHDL